jgi:hypothetical protein
VRVFASVKVHVCKIAKRNLWMRGLSTLRPIKERPARRAERQIKQVLTGEPLKLASGPTAIIVSGLECMVPGRRTLVLLDLIGSRTKVHLPAGHSNLADGRA